MTWDLRTPRLRLRALRPGDAEALAAYRSDPHVARYQSWDAPYPIAEARRLCSAMADAEPDRPGQWYQVAVARLEDDRLIGDCAVGVRADDGRIVDLGYTVAPEHQGRGYGREAVRRLLDHLFHDLGKHRVTAMCDARNVASYRLLEAVGMRREGRLVKSTWAKGEWTDDLVYAVLASEWPPSAEVSPPRGGRTPR